MMSLLHIGRTISNIESTYMKIKITEYQPAHKDIFVSMTKEWLEEYFWIEPCDERLFEDPVKEYISTGGQIFIAVDEDNQDTVAGVCALVFHQENHSWEMSKLSVRKEYRRNGIAEILVDHTISYAKEKGADKLYLDTSKRLGAAVRLYKRKGFQEIPLTNSHYQRTDTQMMIKL